jgi:hypothetical protein
MDSPLNVTGSLLRASYKCTNGWLNAEEFAELLHHSYCTNYLHLGNHSSAEELHCYTADSDSYISMATIQEQNLHQFDGFLKTAFNREGDSFMKTSRAKR